MFPLLFDISLYESIKVLRQYLLVVLQLEEKRKNFITIPINLDTLRQADFIKGRELEYMKTLEYFNNEIADAIFFDQISYKKYFKKNLYY